MSYKWKRFHCISAKTLVLLEYHVSIREHAMGTHRPVCIATKLSNLIKLLFTLGGPTLELLILYSYTRFSSLIALRNCNASVGRRSLFSEGFMNLVMGFKVPSPFEVK
jgi:hypothetical protein